MSMFLALLLAAAPAAPDPAADPRALAAADKLMDATTYDKLMDDTVETMIAGQRAGMADRLRQSMGDQVDEELIAKVGTFIEQEIRAMFRENKAPLRKAYALLYAKNFTAEELERLTVLQSDPVMQKSLKVLPGMMNELMTLMRGITDKRRDGMEERLHDLIAKHMAQSKG